MNSHKFEILLFCMIYMVAVVISCSPQPDQLTFEPATAVPTAPAEITKPVIPTPTISPDLPLSGLGDLAVGVRRGIVLVDDSRNGRVVSLTIWYPAKPGQGDADISIADAEPEFNSAPYPVILSSSKMGQYIARALVSHGFMYVGVDKIDSWMKYDNSVIDQPQDLLFALKSVTENPPAELYGMFNTDVVGAIGYSFDAFNALTLGGARVDPQAYQADCANAAQHVPLPPDWWIDYICNLVDQWTDFKAHAGSAITASDDGLWQPISDPRIQAVMPMGPEGAWLFNKRGLAAVNRPIFIISAEHDDINIYDLEAVPIYDGIITSDKYMVTILGRDHMMIFASEPVKIMSHFANAFFGYYLQGKEEYKNFFSEDFVRNYDNLAWGIYHE